MPSGKSLSSLFFKAIYPNRVYTRRSGLQGHTVRRLAEALGVSTTELSAEAERREVIQKVSEAEVAKHRFTVEEFRKMGEAGIFGEDDRVELVEGEIVEKMAAPDQSEKTDPIMHRVTKEWTHRKCGWKHSARRAYSRCAPPRSLEPPRRLDKTCLLMEVRAMHGSGPKILACWAQLSFC